MNVEKQYSRISGNWVKYFNRLTRRTEKRFVLSTQHLLNQLEKQKGKCALSGIELTCFLEKGKKFKTNASIDRIIPGKEYTSDNIQLICSALNSWRSDTDLQEFIWFCEQVTKYQKEIKNALSKEWCKKLQNGIQEVSLVSPTEGQPQ